MTVIQLGRTRKALARIRSRRRARAVEHPMTTSVALVFACTGILLAGGLIMILSSSWVAAYARYGSPYMFFQRQLLWAAGGVTAMLVVSRIDYHRWRRAGYALLLVAVAGLVLVLHPAVGTTVGGSSRWLGVGPFRFQPSELAKLALVLVGADLCARKLHRLRTVKDVMLPLGIFVAIIGGLVMLQPDLGTTLILGGITFTVLFVAGAPMRTLATLGAGATGSAVMLAFSSPYRRDRMLSFLHPAKDALNTGYQAVQAQIALGSGGVFGVGLGAGRQKWLYVPNAHTDFIFAIIGEEMGLFGTFLVIGVFATLGYAGVRIARRAPDVFGRIVAGGVTAWIVGQAIVNMGAVTGVLPITGVPLPFVSFGGSSLLFTLTGVGILANIARHEQWPPKRAKGSQEF